jgi:3-dehydroquinate synthase
MMKKIRLKLRTSQSEILVETGAYENILTHMEDSGLHPPFMVVSQEKVLSHFGKRPLGRNPVVTISDGERAKTLRTVSRLIDAMLELGLTRQSTVIALGGGVVGDVAGFAASVYLRGISVVQVPTTLLAQVDSSVGGKTGVNHKAGKNLIGAFHQPRLVIADPKLLTSLPSREYRSGLWEALKYGVIRDRNLFDHFEGRLMEILRQEPAVLEDLVYRCLRIKADVVGIDEKEGGLRRILNFGHTLGHAIEAASNYRGIRHGEAVGLGMIGATRIAEQLGRISGKEASRIDNAVRSIGPLPSIAKLSVKDMMKSMRHDKKIRDGDIHFVLPRRIGKVDVEAGIPPKLVESVLRSLSQ